MEHARMAGPRPRRATGVALLALSLLAAAPPGATSLQGAPTS
ncbi:molecular chaperone, partial [Stenotrophomonas maltophilia]